MRRGIASLALLLITALSAPTASAGPALLFEVANGKVLFAEDVDNDWHPASLTKLMTAYLVFQEIKSGRLSLTSKIACSAAANKEPPSKIGIPVGGELTVDKALQALIIKSANDVAVMLAEAVAGNEPAFVERMNATAKRLGMTRTTFVNANGLPADEQVTTARDLAKLSRAILTDFPEYAHYWSMPHMRFGKNRLNSHNQLLQSVDGADGLKTGFTCRFRLQHRCERHPRRPPACRRRARQFNERGAQRPRREPARVRLPAAGLGPALEQEDPRQHAVRADGGGRHQRAGKRRILELQSQEARPSKAASQAP